MVILEELLSPFSKIFSLQEHIFFFLSLYIYLGITNAFQNYCNFHHLAWFFFSFYSNFSYQIK